MPAVDPGEVLAREPALGLLELAVPLWIDRLAGLTAGERIARAARCGQTVASHGDSIQYRDRHTSEAFNALAEGLACAAYQPGGVSFASMHWCAGQCHTCHGAGMIWPAQAPCMCDPGPEGQHAPWCGSEPCPAGCEIPAPATEAAAPETQTVDVSEEFL